MKKHQHVEWRQSWRDDTQLRAGMIEAWGAWHRADPMRMLRARRTAPEFDRGMSGLMLTFRADPHRLRDILRRGQQLGEELGEELGETRSAILRAMLRDPKVTTARLARSLGISTTAVDKQLKILKTQGRVGRIGTARGGYWRVREGPR